MKAFGTVLKKIYFEDYRFSEDPDFSLVEVHTDSKLLDWFDKVFEHIREEANIPLSVVDHTMHKDDGLNFYIQYTGPLGGSGSNKMNESK